MGEWHSCVRCGINKRSPSKLCLDCSNSDPSLHPGRTPLHIGCTVEGCEGKHHARGLCSKHYNELWFDKQKQVAADALWEEIEPLMVVVVEGGMAKPMLPYWEVRKIITGREKQCRG